MGNNIWHNEPDNAVVKNPPASVGDIRDMGSILKLGRSPGVGNGNPLQYSCLENPMDRRAWGPTVHRVAEESDRTEQLTNNFVWRSSAPLLSAAPLVDLPGLQSWVCARACTHTHTHTHIYHKGPVKISTPDVCFSELHQSWTAFPLPPHSNLPRCPQHFRGRDERAVEGNSRGSKSLLYYVICHPRGCSISIFWHDLQHVFNNLKKIHRNLTLWKRYKSLKFLSSVFRIAKFQKWSCGN